MDNVFSTTMRYGSKGRRRIGGWMVLNGNRSGPNLFYFPVSVWSDPSMSTALPSIVLLWREKSKPPGPRRVPVELFTTTEFDSTTTPG